MITSLRKIPLVYRGLVGLLIGVAGFLTATQVNAGPVTGGVTNPPYVEAAVYQGVIGNIPGGAGESIMEIGNGGQDIASTGDLFLRPQRLGLVSNTSIRFAKNATTGKTDLHVYGKLCLTTCLDTWPTPGGTSFWAQNGSSLQPATSTHGVYSDTTGTNNSFDPIGLEVYGDHASSALSITKTSGSGLALEGYRTEIQGNLDVTGAITTLQCDPAVGSCGALGDPNYLTGTVWHPGNDGTGSNLDAGSLDGVDFRVDYNTSPGGPKCDGAANQWCLCGEFFQGFGTSYDCVDLN